MKKKIEFNLYMTTELRTTRPTCAEYIPDGKVCPFLAQRRMGTKDFCTWLMEDIHIDCGYTVVSDRCPLWEGVGKGEEV